MAEFTTVELVELLKALDYACNLLDQWYSESTDAETDALCKSEIGTFQDLTAKINSIIRERTK